MGNTFTIDVNINNVANMAYAQLDLQFNSNFVNYSSCNPTSLIGSGSGTAGANWMQTGLVRIIVDYSDYASTHGGTGITGSGYLCRLTFSAIAQGTSPLNLVAGQGFPTGKLTLLSWIAYSESEIENVGWTSSSVTVVN